MRPIELLSSAANIRMEPAMTTKPPRPSRKRTSAPQGDRDRAGRFARTAVAADVGVVTATHPPLEKARLTMPAPDFERLRGLKLRLKELDRPTRKNELLRAGIHALCQFSDEALLLAVEQLPPAKPPKPPKAPKPPRAAKPAKAAKLDGARKRPAAKPKVSARIRKAGASVDD